MGPGTELKRLLSKLGFVATPQCKCDQRAQIMDEQGCDWCYSNIVIIIGWLKEEAKERQLLFIELPARTIILLAIRNARKKERILASD